MQDANQLHTFSGHALTSQLLETVARCWTIARVVAVMHVLSDFVESDLLGHTFPSCSVFRSALVIENSVDLDSHEISSCLHWSLP